MWYGGKGLDHPVWVQLRLTDDVDVKEKGSVGQQNRTKQNQKPNDGQQGVKASKTFSNNTFFLFVYSQAQFSRHGLALV